MRRRGPLWEGPTSVGPKLGTCKRALAPEVFVAKPPRDRSSVSTNTYFATARAFEGQALFQSERTAKLLIETIFGYRDQKKYLLHEFVVMPNHLHLLLTPVAAVTIERTMQFIKGGYSYRARKELGMNVEIWQRGYVDHCIRDGEDFFRHRHYIRLNAVKAHLAEAPEEYRYCSAHPSFELDVVPPGLKPPR